MKGFILNITFFVFVALGSTNALASNFKVNYGIATSYDGEKIAYSKSGKGKTGKGKTALIFIHGWSLDNRLWQNQIQEFSQEHQVLAIDLAGHGNSSFNRKEYTMIAFAKDIKAVIEKEELNSAILVGHSMAGGVIAEAAKLMPKKVKAIIGVDTSQNVALPLSQSELDAMVKPFETDFQAGITVFVNDSLPKDVDEDLLYLITQDMASAPPAIAINQFRHYLGQYVTGEAHRVYESVNVPLILINARIWPTDSEANRKHIKDYSVYFIEDSGHFPMLEQPKKFNETLMKVIKSVE